MAGFSTDQFGTDPFGAPTSTPTGPVELIISDLSLTGVAVDAANTVQLQILDLSVQGVSVDNGSAMLMWNGTKFIPIDLYVWDGTKAISLNTPVYASL